MLREVPSRLTAATLFPRSSARLLDRWRKGDWCVEHGDVARLRAVTGIAELLDIEQVLALGPAKISAYGVSARAATLQRGGDAVRILQSIDHLTPSQALGAYDIGLSLLCGDLMPLIPDLAHKVEGLLEEFGLPARGSGARRLLDLTGVEPIEAVMSFSPAGADAALGLHYDAFDVIALQLEGTKVWMLGANEDVSFPLSSFDTEAPRLQSVRADPALERVELRPGTALFVPRGVWHCTKEVGPGAPSVTLLLKMSPPSFVEVLITALFAQLGERPEWRAPCVGLFRRAELRADAVDTFAALTAKLQLHADELLLNHYMRERAPAALLTFHRESHATVSMERTAPDAREVVVRVESSAGTSEITVDPALVPVCRWIATTAADTITAADVRAYAGAVSLEDVEQLLVALEGAGLLVAAVLPPVAAPPPAPSVRRVSKR